MISAADSVNLSNMSVETETVLDDDALVDDFFFRSDQDVNGWKHTQFHKSPKMSTYLVALANGPFQYTEASYTSPISGITKPVRVYGM